MNKVEDLVIWQKSVDLAVKIYTATNKFPTEERYGLTSQMRRAGVSIAANIAEGAGRNSKKEFVNFLAYSSGSSSELMTEAVIAEKVGLLNAEITKELLADIQEIQKMNRSLQLHITKQSK